MIVRRVVDNGVGALQLEPGDGELAARRLERLLERAQVAQRRGHRRCRRLIVGRGTPRPPAEAADYQGAKQDESSL